MLTRSSLRHEFFARRIFQEFEKQIVGCFEIDPHLPESGGHGGSPSKNSPNMQTQLALKTTPFEKLQRSLKKQGWRRTYDMLQKKLARRKFKKIKRQSHIKSEDKIVFPLLDQLRKTQAGFKFEKIKNPNSPEFIKRLSSIKPYFILTLGGPLYSNALLDCATGFAINQHAGFSPDLKGSGTITWALYHRRLERVAATIHLLSSGADTGPILRYAYPSLLSDDTPTDCFIRTVIAGTETLIDCVKEITNSETIEIFPQPPYEGKTYLSEMMGPEKMSYIERDFKAGWLEEALTETRSF